jgi:hypothetical protein
MANLSLLSDVNKLAVCLTYFPRFIAVENNEHRHVPVTFPTDLRDITSPEPGIKGPGQK